MTRDKRFDPEPQALDLSSAYLDDGELLVRRLRDWRKSEAIRRGTQPHTIFADKALAHIAYARPSTLDELATIHGIGKAKLRDFGAALLAIVANPRASFADLGITHVANPERGNSPRDLLHSLRSPDAVALLLATIVNAHRRAVGEAADADSISFEPGVVIAAVNYFTAANKNPLAGACNIGDVSAFVWAALVIYDPDELADELYATLKRLPKLRATL